MGSRGDEGAAVGASRAQARVEADALMVFWVLERGRKKSREVSTDD